jgi:hypothetical protein
MFSHLPGRHFYILRLCTWSTLIYFNPFLFIKGLSCPRTVQTLLTQNFLKLTIRTVQYLDNLSNSFLFLVVTFVLNKYICKVLVWKSLPLLPYRALLSFENSSAASPLQIIMAVRRFFIYILKYALKNAIPPSPPPASRFRYS